MKLVTSLLLLLSTLAFAGLPPTSSKGAGDSSYKTTFKFNFGSMGVTHTGTELAITSVPASMFSGLAANAPLSYLSGTTSIALATTSTDGYLSSTDWNTFNNKQATVSGSNPIGFSANTITLKYLAPLTTTNGSLAIPVATSLADGYLSSTDWSTFNSKQATVSSTDPISFSANTIALKILSPLTTTNGSLAIPVATSGVNGYLSSTDWSTFNNKQATLTFTPPLYNVANTVALSGTLQPGNGGTGLSAAIAAGNFLYSNGSVYSAGSIAAGTGVTVGNVGGVYTINATGTGTVSSIASGTGITNNPSTITGVGTVSLSVGTKGRVISSNGTTSEDLPAGTFGQQVVANSNTATGLEYRTPLFKNYVTNPSCGTLGVTGITVTNGTIAQNTSSPLDSQTDCAISATASGGKYSWAVNTFDNGLTVAPQNCEAKFIYSGTATAFKAYVSINGTTQTATLAGTLNSSGIYDYNFPCATGTALLNIEATASTSAIKVANVYVGPQTNIGSVSAISDLVSAGAISISATTTPPTKGTTTVDDVSWSMNGQSATIVYRYRQSSAGATGTGLYLLSIPTALGSINTAITGTSATTTNANSTNQAAAMVSISGNVAVDSADNGALRCWVYSSTQIACVAESYASSTNSQWGSAFFGFGNATLAFEIIATVPISGWTSSSNAIRNNITPSNWAGYHDSTCSWARTNASYGDPTADASCAFTERQNQNFGTVTSQVSGSDKLPGIIFTPKTSGLYLVCVNAYGAPNITAVGATIGVQLTDGTTVVSESVQTGLVSTSYQLFSNCSMFNASSTASTTVKLQSKSSAGQVTIGGNGGSAVEWSIGQVSSGMNNPVLIGSITSRASTPKVLSVVEFSNGGSCAVTSDPEGMVASVSDPGAGLCGIVLTSGYFSAAPKCWCNATLKPLVAGYQCETQFGTSATLGTTYTATSGGTDSDQPFTLYCLGQRN